MECDKKGCDNKAVIKVSDGPHGLSREVNIYYLCDEHKPPPFSFENWIELNKESEVK